jgi:hypothetical protein
VILRQVGASPQEFGTGAVRGSIMTRSSTFNDMDAGEMKALWA